MRNSARRVAIEATNVERHFVMEDTDATAYNCPVAGERRPGKACPRSQVLLAGNLLVFIAQAEIETQIRAHQPAILYEANVLSIVSPNPRGSIKCNPLGEQSIAAQDVDWTRSVVQPVAHAIEIKADFDFMRAAPEFSA